MGNNRGFIGIGAILAVVAVLAVGGIVYYAGTKNASLPDNPIVDNSQSKTGENTISQDAPINGSISENPAGTVTTKIISRSSYSFTAPKNWIDNGQRNFNGCLWDGISNDANDGLRMAGEVGIYPKYCFDISKAAGRKEVTEKDGYYIVAFYDKQSGTTAEEEAETIAAYKLVAGTFKLSSNAGQTSSVKIALLSMPNKDGDQSKMKGCDLVGLVERQIKPTTAPLNAAMNELFAKKEPWPYSESYPGNFISSQKNLYFDKATIDNGVANIYLTGSYSLSGACDDPRIETEIDATAMQFNIVKEVKIFLNNEPLKIPSLKGQ